MPTSVLVTLFKVPASVTLTLLPASAVTLTTPAAAVAAAKLTSDAGPLLSTTVGATVSITCSALTNSTFGLPAVSRTAFAFRLRLMLPPVMGTSGVTVTDQVVPLPVTAVTTPLTAVKLLITSPVTTSLNV